MKRRDAIKNSAFLAGCGLSAGTIAAFISGCNSETLPKGNFFSGNDLKLVELVVDTFLPKTESASASEAGVHTFLDENIGSAMTADEQDNILEALQSVRDQSQKQYSKAFDKLTQNEREAALLSVDKVNRQHFKVLQGTTLYIYYTSEIGATQALAYLPLPGEFIPCMPFEEVGKAWAL